MNWIETQDGELLNIVTGASLVISPPKNDNRGWWIVLNHNVAGASRICAEYAKESDAMKVFEDFKNKLRRSGEKIFKFKEEADANEISC